MLYSRVPYPCIHTNYNQTTKQSTKLPKNTAFPAAPNEALKFLENILEKVKDDDMAKICAQTAIAELHIQMGNLDTAKVNGRTHSPCRLSHTHARTHTHTHTGEIARSLGSSPCFTLAVRCIRSNWTSAMKSCLPWVASRPCTLRTIAYRLSGTR